MALPILTTKLFIPQINDRYIMREALVRKLAEGFFGNSRIALVCAPAGFGKTTLVLEFLQSVQEASAWFSIDEGDNDHNRYLAYLAAAFKKAGLAMGSDLDATLTDMGLNTTETVLTMIINNISESLGRIILILDDYHLVRSQKIHDMMKFLLEHQPPNLFLIILSREDPPLPLARLRMEGQLTEIRMGDLVFTRQETAELFEKTMGIRLSNQAVERVMARTEGWVAGLQLAGLLLKSYGEDQAEDCMHQFDGTNAYIIDYLVDEVLKHQTREVRDFLVKTSVLERMNARLCDALTGGSEGREILSQIERANLFLIPLDHKREWYRYHPLFADSLKTCLLAEEEKSLYGKAAQWMKANHFSYEAVRYGFKSGDLVLALKMVEDTVEESFRDAQLESMVQWIGQFPEDVIRNSEALCVRKALAYFATGRSKEAIQYLSTLDHVFEQTLSRHNKGLLFSIRAMIAGMMGQDSESLAIEALSLLEPWDPIAITSAYNTLGRAQYRKGRWDESLVTFKSAFESGMKLGYQYVTTLALMHYSACLGAAGRRQEAITLCHQFIEGMKKHFNRLPPFVGILYVTLSLLYNDHEPQKAQLYKDEGMPLCEVISYDIENALKLFAEAGTQKGGAVLDYGERLSEREAEILGLLGKGHSNQEIAKALFISTNTTQWHISHIYAKLGVKSRTQAVLKAKELGILP